MLPCLTRSCFGAVSPAAAGGTERQAKDCRYHGRRVSHPVRWGMWGQGQTGAFAHAKVQKALVTQPGPGVHARRLHMEPKQQGVWTARHPLKLAEMYCVCMCVSTCVCVVL